MRISFKYIEGMRLVLDLYDTQISVCKQNILNYYTENFDYHNERDEFMKDFLSSEITLEEIAFCEIHEGYIRRVKNSWDLWKANQDALKK